MNLKNKYIHVPDLKLSTIVQTRLFELGYKWASGKQKVLHYSGQYLGFDNNGNIVSLIVGRGEEIKIQDLFTTFPPFTPPRPDVILPPGEIVPGYAVVIGEKGITVGCQTVSFTAFETLAAAVERYLSNK